MDEGSPSLQKIVISFEDAKSAEIYKSEANDYFKRQNYDKAIEIYTKAIEKNSNVAIYYANRSFAYLKTECFGYALADASKSVELDRSYVKGYYRRAAANMSLGKWKDALKDYEYQQHTLEDEKINEERLKLAVGAAYACNDISNVCLFTLNVEWKFDFTRLPFKKS